MLFRINRYPGGIGMQGQVSRRVAYLVLVVMIYGLHRAMVYVWDNNWFNLGIATTLLVLFTLFVLKIERKEFERMPLFGKFLRQKPT